MQIISVIASTLALGGLVAAAPTEARDVATRQSTYPLITFLAWGDVKYTATGVSQQCYNTPWPFSSLSTSLWPAANIPGCWAYDAADCAGTYKIIPAAGWDDWTEAVKSFICDPWTS